MIGYDTNPTMNMNMKIKERILNQYDLVSIRIMNDSNYECSVAIKQHEPRIRYRFLASSHPFDLGF